MNSYFSELVAHVQTTNTVTADSIVKVRKNGADTSISTTILASTTGDFIDSTNTELFADTDDINLVLITGATGTSMTIRSFGLSILEKLPIPRTLSETEIIGESKTRTKAVWRLQP